MTSNVQGADNTKLSNSVTIARYRQYEINQDRDKIANFIDERFRERYITPIKDQIPGKKHGFCTMAICCLMIETLESFWQGWPDTMGKSPCAFQSFFQRDAHLSAFKGYEDEFYKHVRCGILHQAETTGGWHIRRDGDLFDVNTKYINATKFHSMLEQSLIDYCNDLRQSSWNDKIWENLRNKMAAICNNCLP